MARNLATPVPLLSALSHRRGDTLRALLGGAMLLAVWLFLWSWVAIGVAAPLSQLPFEPPSAVRS